MAYKKEIFSVYNFFWKSTKTFCKFLGTRNIVRNKRIGLNCLFCRADHCVIYHFFCSLCPSVVNGLTTRRDFHKTTKYRNCLRSLLVTCDHLKLLLLDRGYKKTVICHEDQLDMTKNLLPSIYFGQFFLCSKICQTFVCLQDLKKYVL